MTFVFGGYEIEKIVSNEAVDMNGDKYRVVLGTHVFQGRPEFLDVMAQAGEPTFRDRRFRALLKYDAFDSKWKLQIADVGLSSASDTVLARRSMCGLAYICCRTTR